MTKRSLPKAVKRSLSKSAKRTLTDSLRPLYNDLRCDVLQRLRGRFHEVACKAIIEITDGVIRAAIADYGELPTDEKIAYLLAMRQHIEDDYTETMACITGEGD